MNSSAQDLLVVDGEEEGTIAAAMGSPVRSTQAMHADKCRTGQDRAGHGDKCRTGQGRTGEGFISKR
jgi:hypothetical protein